MGAARCVARSAGWRKARASTPVGCRPAAAATCKAAAVASAPRRAQWRQNSACGARVCVLGRTNAAAAGRAGPQRPLARCGGRKARCRRRGQPCRPPPPSLRLAALGSAPPPTARHRAARAVGPAGAAACGTAHCLMRRQQLHRVEPPGWRRTPPVIHRHSRPVFVCCMYGSHRVIGRQHRVTEYVIAVDRPARALRVCHITRTMARTRPCECRRARGHARGPRLCAST